MASEPMWTVYFINVSHLAVCMHVYVARQRLGKYVTSATNTQTTIEEWLDFSFSMRFMSYQRKIRDYFFPELIVIYIFICICCHVFLFTWLIIVGSGSDL
jgi:hypothetical protein